MFERMYLIVRDEMQQTEIRVVARYYPGTAQSWFEQGEPEEFEVVSSVDDLNGHHVDLHDSEVTEIKALIHRSYNNRGLEHRFDTDDGIF
ncbi:MAG: hypothetical protein GOVbin1454_14 [Prokaryotic dsDNA virus sp.]|nr:MAG: hypothetical protein GOVbin1454_14 [Prokaryotic dsDNA virus sp.]|tara:strand:- start:2483 stop:2752 length:270 start_codon:yes stop_codon:yes gene_type:complete